MSQNALQPQGNTVCLAVTSVAHTAVQVSGAGPATINYELSNAGSYPCFVAFSAPANGGAAPAITPAIPVDGTAANGYPILAGQTKTITAPANSYFSAICAAAQTTTLYITPGEGL